MQRDLFTGALVDLFAGVADALAWAMRTYTLTDEYGAMRADATGAMNDALRALADAARGSK